MAKKYDVFISHASEDKQTVVTPLAAALAEEGLSVWLDQYEITVGDPILRKIDEGLKQSLFGVVILSKAFFSKFYTMTEFQTLMQRQELTKTILPVLHDMDQVELEQRVPALAGLLNTRTQDGPQIVAKQIAAAVARAKEERAKSRAVTIDLSHKQTQWNSFVASAQRLFDGNAFELRNGIAAHMDDLADSKVLVMALGGRESEFSQQDITLVHDWVYAGGGLFLLGYYLADTHHFTNPSSLGRELGFSFRNDIVMPPGKTSFRENQDQAFDPKGEFAVLLPVPPRDAHPIISNVRELAVLSACSIAPINAPEYELRVPSNSAVVMEATGRPNEKGYLRQIHEYVPTTRTEPTILAAWQYGKGRVVAAGTWKLFTLDQKDNLHLVRNVIAWLGFNETK
jgi:TIR domain-containing protein